MNIQIPSIKCANPECRYHKGGWYPRVAQPKQCPSCGTRRWNDPKARRRKQIVQK